MSEREHPISPPSSALVLTCHLPSQRIKSIISSESHRSPSPTKTTDSRNRVTSQTPVCIPTIKDSCGDCHFFLDNPNKTKRSSFRRICCSLSNNINNNNNLPLEQRRDTRLERFSPTTNKPRIHPRRIQRFPFISCHGEFCFGLDDAALACRVTQSRLADIDTTNHYDQSVPPSCSSSPLHGGLVHDTDGTFVVFPVATVSIQCPGGHSLWRGPTSLAQWHLGASTAASPKTTGLLVATLDLGRSIHSSTRLWRRSANISCTATTTSTTTTRTTRTRTRPRRTTTGGGGTRATRTRRRRRTRTRFSRCWYVGHFPHLQDNESDKDGTHSNRHGKRRPDRRNHTNDSSVGGGNGNHHHYHRSFHCGQRRYHKDDDCILPSNNGRTTAAEPQQQGPDEERDGGRQPRPQDE